MACKLFRLFLNKGEFLSILTKLLSLQYDTT
nr:MAG TPA: hypothetical protein [Caudoviricetes sp.]DAQ99403.1 MAG TPA: hypothetical protein [Caudoviricetes sp.]